MNFLLKIVEGPNKGAEIALVEGVVVSLGKRDDCDIVLADATLPEDYSAGEMVLRRLPLETSSPFVGKPLKESGIRNHYHCLVAGVERADGNLHIPDPNRPLEEGDTLWLVGEHKDIDALLGEKESSAIANLNTALSLSNELVEREYLAAYPGMSGKYSFHLCESADGIAN